MRTTYTVQVHKANIPLMAGESLRAFTKELTKQAVPVLLQKFNSDEKKGGAWPLEVFATKAVYMIAPEWSDAKKDQMVAFEFERDDKGAFKLGEVVKVKAVTQYEVQKQAALPRHMEMAAWTPAEAPVEKNFWAGALG